MNGRLTHATILLSPPPALPLCPQNTGSFCRLPSQWIGKASASCKFRNTLETLLLAEYTEQAPKQGRLCSPRSLTAPGAAWSSLSCFVHFSVTRAWWLSGQDPWKPRAKSEGSFPFLGSKLLSEDLSQTRSESGPLGRVIVITQPCPQWNCTWWLTRGQGRRGADGTLKTWPAGAFSWPWICFLFLSWHCTHSSPHYH